MSEVILKGLKKVYDNKVTAVHDVNLEIADKEFIVLVGPSGCGKSTTLRMVAGLEEISDGELLIDGKVDKAQTQYICNGANGADGQNGQNGGGQGQTTGRPGRPPGASEGLCFFFRVPQRLALGDGDGP